VGEETIKLTNKHKQQTVNWLIFISVLLVATNLRVPLTSVGPLIPTIREDLLINNTLAGFITTIPLLALAFISPLVPKVANRTGMGKAILISLIILIAGFLIRSYTGVVGLFTGTIIIGVAIAFGNVLLPGFIKLNFPLRVGLVTGFYSIFMNTTGAIGSGLSVPLTTLGNIGWNGSLAFFVILAIIALISWSVLMTRAEIKEINISSSQTKRKTNMWKSKLAWSITLFMGLQSLVFYTLVTWLPDLLLHHDYSQSEAGWMLFLLQISLFPTTFLVPIFAERMKDQKALSILGASLFLFGSLGLLFGSGFLIILSVMSFGLGSGVTFSLSMMFFTLRTTDAQQAAEVSGMAQSIGYLLAAIGPVLFGALYDLTGTWVGPMSLLIISALVLFVVGIQSGRKHVIE